MTPREHKAMASLTVDEVFALKHGSTVTISWNGGNGPHEYEMRMVNGAPCAYMKGAFGATYVSRIVDSRKVRERLGFKNKYPIHHVTRGGKT